MKSITLGLALSLLGGAALAQTPPSAPPPSPPPALKQPAAAPTPPSSPPNAQAAPSAPQGQQNAQNGQPPIPAPSGPPEGMVVETPNGFYLVRPGDPNPQRLDVGRNGGPGPQGMGQPGMGPEGMGQPGRNGPAAMGEGDDAMGDMAEDGMQPPPPHRRGPPRPSDSKGARLHIHTPNLDVNVKCPDDEPIKACVDAISQLMDKANTAAH